LIYYFNESQSSPISGYKVLSIEPSGAAEQTVVATTSGTTPVLVSDFISDEIGQPLIPFGTQRFHIHFLKSNAGNSIEAFAELQLADSTGTLIGSTLTTNMVLIGYINASTPVETLFDVVFPSIVIDPTDRMVVRLYVKEKSGGSSHNVTFYTEGTSNYSYVVTSLSAPAGDQGPQGPQGATGTQGVQGSTGPQGVQGVQGPQGFQGFQGHQGDTGAQGFQGTQGFQGAQGTQGFQGDTGAQGATGAQGFQGFQGTQGTQGFQGPTGPQGSTGAQGFQGDQGPTGPQGVQGTTGAQGATGAQGVQGPQGFQGFQGVQGPQGAGTITGSGTTNTIPKFTGSTAIGDSAITDNGTTVTLVSRALSGTSATFSSTVTASAFIPSGSSVPTNGMYLSGANTLDFATNSTNRLTITSGGNVGIGIDNPALPLHVQGPLLSGFVNMRAFDSASMAANVGGGLSFGGKYTSGGTYTDFAFIKGNKENGTSEDFAGYLNFYTRANAGSFTERMRITSGGNVGIGTTTDAGFKLDVNGTGRFSGRLQVGSDSIPSISVPTGGDIFMIPNAVILSGLIYPGSPYTQNIQIDIVYNNWGSNNVIGLVDMIITLREFGNTSGTAFGKVFATNTGSAATFSTFNTANITTSQCSVTAASGGNYTLRITIDPSNVTDIGSYYLLIPSIAGTGTAVSSITVTYV
jgi:hypothetical protein